MKTIIISLICSFCTGLISGLYIEAKDNLTAERLKPKLSQVINIRKNNGSQNVAPELTMETVVFKDSVGHNPVRKKKFTLFKRKK
jgi:hypothetical protein